MKKQLVLSLLTLTLFAACQTANKAEMQREEGSRVLVSNKGDMYHTEQTNTRLTRVGYSHKQKNEVSNRQVGTINREKVAEMITDMTVKLPDVTNAATLVTDDEVFVVYRAKTTDPALVTDQVYKTALSIVPRYYKAYVSTDQKLISQIQGLQSGTLNDKEYTQSLDMLKREMSKNPHLNNSQTDTLGDMIKK
ncbi:YhcN/YlaJ family sporulation lipoprotein [Bacillus sp. DX1.1]|uniref:YhcN/YlaJ family sporulation lipoprotein n=1 Tax=unclassified Bacillus (in: firmicutes) TaxID=185979 RepID=UPI00256FB1BF|nr:MULTISPECIES: YhcN/YlaJ family sporulation lipoprotein [unclassified Bacillus (in: firmicutes)]MDM5157092.1 YhcN/YlaJ family sporulation lipoprotein [Bacillus sp. DX1.1]WJE81328.1 YhcN/YlaJ family sporulation lipoprotein [Bacillus sp. DX3.1]